VNEYGKGLKAATSMFGASNAHQMAQHLLSQAREDVATPAEAEGFAMGLKMVANEINRIARQARERAGEQIDPRPMSGDRVAQHRHMYGPDGLQVEWRETVGEILAVERRTEALGGWVALVFWPDLRGRERLQAHEAFDFGEHAGPTRVRIVEEVEGG
jgi:hypothetical protein